METLQGSVQVVKQLDYDEALFFANDSYTNNKNNISPNPIATFV